jgi:DNA-binding CsgD family transcriptional regulator
VLLGRIDEAEAALEVLRPSATADFWGLGELFTCLAEAALWGGRPDLARERAEAALAVPAPLPVATIHARLTLAWACRELGLPIEEVDDVALTPSSSAAPIELRAIGAAAAGDDVGAAASFKAAGASWHRFHEPRSLICRWAAGEALGRAGEKSDGIEEIQLALESAQAIGFEPLAARARRSLRLLGVRVSQKSPEPPAHALGLTARERELVSLVERGLTNVEIARRLGLGRPTVARMLGSAMAKLGVTSRAELAAIVPG